MLSPLTAPRLLLLATAMAALGLTTHVSALRMAGPKPLILSAVLSIWPIGGGGAINWRAAAWLDRCEAPIDGRRPGYWTVPFALEVMLPDGTEYACANPPAIPAAQGPAAAASQYAQIFRSPHLIARDSDGPSCCEDGSSNLVAVLASDAPDLRFGDRLFATRSRGQRLATVGGAPVLPVFKMTGSPSFPEPTMITLEFGDSANFSVASMPFHWITCSFNPLLMIDW